MQRFTKRQLALLRREFLDIKHGTIESLPKFRAVFAKMSDAQIDQIIAANINLVSALAVNERTRRATRRDVATLTLAAHLDAALSEVPAIGGAA